MLRLDGVTLVDTHEGKLTPGMSILMDKGSIVSVTPTTEVSKDPSIMSIDAIGKSAILGFTDIGGSFATVLSSETRYKCSPKAWLIDRNELFELFDSGT